MSRRVGSPGAPEGGEVQVVSSGWKLALREFAQNKLALFGVLVIVFFILFSFVGPLVYHTNQTLFNPLETDLPPGHGHPLGTDQQRLRRARPDHEGRSDRA